MVNNNKTINPSASQSMVESIFLARSKRIKKVTLVKSGQGGASGDSGNVYVPAGETAYDRTVRLHEALHVDFTTKKFEPKDAMDQGLEDARLHRHCANTKAVRSARRDEITTAIKDLRKSIKKARTEPVKAITSLVVLRAASILHGESKYSKLLNQAAKLVSSDYLAKVNKSIDLIKDGTESENWQTARKILGKYFSKDFQPEMETANSESKSGSPEQSESKKSKKSEPKDKNELPDLPQFDEGEQEDKETKSEESESDSDESEETKSDDSKESEESEESDSDESETEDGESDSEGESEESEDDIADASDSMKDNNSFDGDGDEVDANTENDFEGSAEGEDVYSIIEVEKVKKPTIVKIHPDAYRGPSISKHDLNQGGARMLHAKYPKKLIIHRLDNASDSVPTLDGARGRTSSMSGCRINAGRLAMAARNNVRVFNRRRGEGGGAILIDNSGSMSIPDSVLINFASSLPLATIAFYSAKNDRDRTKEGHLSIFAANGRRASKVGAQVYGGYGNLVDYQAITWLLEQPGPRWYIGDLAFTGAWDAHCLRFFRSLVERKMVNHVRTLNEMTQILKLKR